MKPLVKVALFAAAVAVGATALAHEVAGHRGEMFQHHVAKRIDEALDVAQATPAQRKEIEAIRDRLFASLHGAAGKPARHADMGEALALFEADSLDRTKVAELRARHEAEARAHGDAIVSAITEAHAVLTPVQRRAIGEWARTHRPGHHERMEAFVQARITDKVNDALDEVKATDPQRTAIHAALDHVFATWQATHGDLGAQIDRAIVVFTSDRLDPAQVAALRAAHQQHQTQLADAVVQAISDAHDALTGPQRKQLAGWVRAHHPHLDEAPQHLATPPKG